MAYVNISETSCCAVNEIVDLHLHKGPIAFLKSLCASIYGYRYYDEADPKPAAFYIFTGVTAYKKGHKIQTGYGEALAAYIKVNNLGVVTASPKRINRVNYPEHTICVWTWCPSERNLKAWYKGHK